MARKRLISPEFFQHGPLYDAEVATGLPLRLAFAGLWCQADREGRFRMRPRELKLGVLPYDNVDFGAVLSALQTYGFIKGYVVDGEAFAYIPSFAKWQTFHVKEGASTVPAPCETGASTEKSGASTAITVTVTGTGTDTSNSGVSDSNTEQTAKPDYRTEFATLRSLYPKREGAQGWPQAEAKYIAHRKAGVTYEAVEEGVRNYAALCAKNGSLGTKYVCQALTFFGPQRRWEDEYTPAPSTDPVAADLAALLAESSGGYAA